MNVLTDNWIKLTNGEKTNINDILDVPIHNIYTVFSEGNMALIAFMLLKSYLDVVDEKAINEFVQSNNDGKELPIDQIIFSQPRENTKKLGKDLFVKEGGITCLCESCCIQSIIALSLFSPTAGRGYSAGILGQKLMVFKGGNTIREIIERNKTAKKFNVNEIFKSPYKIHLANKINSECSLCGDNGICYTHFKRKANGNVVTPNNLPIAIKTTKNKYHLYKSELTPLQIMSKINCGSFIIPDEMTLEAGDRVSFFSILTNQAKIKSINNIDCFFKNVNFELDAKFIIKCILSFYDAELDLMYFNFYRFIEDRYSENINFNELAMNYFLQYIPYDLSALSYTKQQLIGMAINKMREKYA